MSENQDTATVAEIVELLAPGGQPEGQPEGQPRWPHGAVVARDESFYGSHYYAFVATRRSDPHFRLVEFDGQTRSSVTSQTEAEAHGWKLFEGTLSPLSLQVITDTLIRQREATEAARSRVSELVQENSKAHQELDDFKVRVRDVAREYAEKNNWCGEVNRALSELGIPVNRKYTVEVTLEVEVTRNLGTDDNSESVEDHRELSRVIYDMDRDDLYYAIQSASITEESDDDE